jgi:hypothetical protein
MARQSNSPAIMRLWYSFCALGLAAGCCAADTVVLKNGQRIAGFIDPTADVSPDQVAINTGSGVLRLPKSAIASEDLSFEARKERLQDNDYAGYIDLALWCRAKGLSNEALELLEHALKQKAGTFPVRALYIRLVDEIRGPEKALELYRDYRKDGGTDALTLARLQQLEDAIKQYENDSVTVTNTPTTAKITPTVQGGLETKGWNNEALQWSNPAQPQLITVSTEAGITPALKIDFKGGDKDKATIKRSARLTINQDSTLTFMAQNPTGKPLSLSVAVKTGSKYLFHESPAQTIKPGSDFQTVKIDLRAPNFKSAASNWQNNAPVADINDVKEIQLLIYNGNQDGTLIITGMGFPNRPDL